MAKSLQRQASIYLKFKEFGQAVSLLEQSFKAYELALSWKDERLPVVLESLAELFKRAGQHSRGTELAMRAEKIRNNQ